MGRSHSDRPASLAALSLWMRATFSSSSRTSSMAACRFFSISSRSASRRAFCSGRGGMVREVARVELVSLSRHRCYASDYLGHDAIPFLLLVKQLLRFQVVAVLVAALCTYSPQDTRVILAITHWH